MTRDPAAPDATPEATPKTATATNSPAIAIADVPTTRAVPPSMTREDTVRSTEANQLEALRSVPAFLGQFRDRIPDVATCGMRHRLDEALQCLAQHADDQTSSAVGSRDCTRRYLARRQQLVGAHLLPIALIARTTEPPLSELAQFQLPRGKPTARQLATAAHSMAEAAMPHSETFIAAGMPRDFVDQLRRASDAMMAELDARVQERARHRIATEALRTGIASARRMVNVLDAFVRSACEQDDGVLAGWTSVKHVRRSVRRAETPQVAPRAPLALIAAESEAPRGDESSVRVSLEHPPIALRRRVFRFFSAPEGARIAVGA